MVNVIKQEVKNEQINKIKNVDFSLIPQANEFQDIIVKSPNRFFNAIMSVSLLTIAACIGSMIAWVLINFS